MVHQYQSLLLSLFLQSECSNLGGNLVAIDDATEDDYVSDFIVEFFPGKYWNIYGCIDWPRSKS